MTELIGKCQSYLLNPDVQSGTASSTAFIPILRLKTYTVYSRTVCTRILHMCTVLCTI